MSGAKVLIVDDEKEIRDIIVKYLKKDGFQVTESENGLTAVRQLETTSFDLVILDIMLGDIDGFEVLQQIRKKNEQLPVILLSAKQEDYDKILGFGLGADDYVTKPFSPAELTARVKARIKRNLVLRESTEQVEILTRGQLMMDLKSYTVLKNGVMLTLSATEFKLLKFFMENSGQVFTKSQIYKQVWVDHFEDDNSVMVYISHLRDKIEDNSREPKYIQTVRGIGYKFVDK